HEGTLRQAGPHPVLDGADRRDGIPLDHRCLLLTWTCPPGRGAARQSVPSATTTAEATPASCERETCRCATPSSSARARTVPCVRRWGRPVLSRTTQASLQRRPTGAPSALASASLAANR